MSKDLKVALLVIVAILVFVLGYQFMRGALFHSSDHEYHAMFTNATSLKNSDKVFLNGVQVGMIRNIEFDNPKRPSKVKITFSVNKDIQIPKNSLIEVISTSLMGNKGLKLNLGESKEIAKSGDILIGVDEKGILDNLTSNMGPLADNSSKLISNVNTMFDRNQKENLYVTIDQMNRTLNNLQMTLNAMNAIIIANQNNINGTLSNVNKITGVVASRQSEIQQIIAHTNILAKQMSSSDIQSSMTKLNASMEQLNTLMTDVNKGKGSLGKLMKDEELYNKLNSTTQSADELLKDMKENPKRYVNFSVFGGKK